jgi:DNA-binding NarL/FixJ family response regulator
VYIKVSITDDHPLVIEGLQNVLRRYAHISLLSSYLDGDALMEGLKKQTPDVLLLDIQMPGKTGDMLTPVILKRYPDLKIITLTNFDSTLYASNMFKLGVHGYLLKSADEQTIINAIETVYNGETFLEETMKQKMEQVEQEATLFTKVSLTPREKDVLKHIVYGKTAQEIADKMFLSIRTVENYRLNIQRKLSAKNTAALVRKALQMGLVE